MLVASAAGAAVVVGSLLLSLGCRPAMTRLEERNIGTLIKGYLGFLKGLLKGIYRGSIRVIINYLPHYNYSIMGPKTLLKLLIKAPILCLARNCYS